MNKKADVNWQIIMMVLALVVLAVMLFIFRDLSFGAKKDFDFYNTCIGKGGDINNNVDSCPPGTMQISADDCKPKDRCVCCIESEKFFERFGGSAGSEKE